MKKKFDFPEFLLSVVKCGGYYGFYFLINLAASFLLVLFFPKENLEQMAVKQAIPLTLLVNAVFLLCTVIFYNTKSQYSSFGERVELNPVNRRVIPYVICLGISMIFVVNIVISVAITALPLPKSWLEMMNENSEMITSASPFLQFITVAIIGPIAEEVLFRGLMLGGLKRTCNRWVAIVATAIVFGLVHGHPIGIIYASCLGVLMGWMYCKTGSLLTTVIFHIVYNTMSLTVPEMSPVAMLIITAMSFAVSVVSIVFIARIPGYTPPEKKDDDNNSEV